MLNPSFVNIVLFYYPIGNTPAVCLTQDLPYQHAADILLLGCGDARNVLFTTYADTTPARRLDITCCDYESAVLARNIMLFSLLMDDVDGSSTASIWGIYYHFYVDDRTLELLQAQSRKLQRLATSVEAWHRSKYGRLLRFCDNDTFASVLKIWKSYCISNFSKAEKDIYNTRFRAGIQKAIDAKRAFSNDCQVLTGLRSAAPVSLQAAQDLPGLYQYFWDNGFTGKVADEKNSNPMFASLATDTFTLHYGLDPLLGYHLSTAYIPLDAKSPLNHSSSVWSQMHKATEAAYLQFSEWSASFRKHARQTLTLRFISADALAVCNVIHHENGVGRDVKCQYRSQYQMKSLLLDGEDYKKGLAPLSFDIIDTSNLVDHLGCLNVLVSASRLLKPKLHSTLYTETLVLQEKRREELLNTLLCGHFPTMAILLGLTPVDYWLNNTAVSTIDEDLFDTVSKLITGGGDNSSEKGQMHSRLAWKLSIPVSDCGGMRPVIRFNENELARLLHAIYQNMFQHENLQNLFAGLGILSLQKNSYPNYHRGSLAMLLQYIKGKVKVDWGVMMGIFLNLVETDQTISMSLNYIQELYCQLHALGVHSVMTFDTNFVHQYHGNFPDGPGSWESLPSIVCLTLKIPRSKLHVFTALSPGELSTPIVHCLLQSSSQSTSEWQNIFADVHLVFGEVSTSGKRSRDDYRVDVIEDAQSWGGSSPLIVSFCAPTWVVLSEPLTTIVSFGVQSTPKSSMTFMKSLGVEMNVYTTKLTDEAHVFITKARPNQSEHLGQTSLSGHGSQGNSASQPKSPVFSAKIEDAKIVALTGRIDSFSANDKARLQENAKVDLTQSSPFALGVRIGGSGQYNLNFPAPVLRSKSNTRIARRSSYVEVTAPIADHVNGDGFPDFMYPIFFHESGPILWNLPCVNLEHLPIINIAKKSELQWLNTHVALQMSSRERQLREKYLTRHDDHDNPRIGFKDSIFSMFMHFSGLQGQQTHVFGLNHPTGGGIHILIFVSSLRLDMANHTVVLDSAILPLTEQLMPRIHSYMGALVSLGVCQIKVDDQELQLWKENIPGFVERSRQWQHLSSCEYMKTSTIPLSVQRGQPMLCSCGNSKFPRGFVSNVPNWGGLSKYAVRAAISPSFSLPYIEKSFYFGGLDLPGESKVGVCRNCHKDDGEGVKLKKCSRCRLVLYCSPECQRSDWKVHKKVCVEVGKYS